MDYLVLAIICAAAVAVVLKFRKSLKSGGCTSCSSGCGCGNHGSSCGGSISGAARK